MTALPSSLPLLLPLNARADPMAFIETSAHQQSCSTGYIASPRSGQGVASHELSFLVDRLLVELAHRRGKNQASAAIKVAHVPDHLKVVEQPSIAEQAPEPPQRMLQKQISMPVLPRRSSSLFQKTNRAPGLMELAESAYTQPGNPSLVPTVSEMVIAVPNATAAAPPKKKVNDPMVLGDGTAFVLVTAASASTTPQGLLEQATPVECLDASGPARQRKSVMISESHEASQALMCAKNLSLHSPHENSQQICTSALERHHSTSQPSIRRNGGPPNEISAEAMQVKTKDGKAISGPMSASSPSMTGVFRFPPSANAPEVRRTRNRRSVSLNAMKFSDALGHSLSASETCVDGHGEGDRILTAPRSFIFAEALEASPDTPCSSRFSWTTNGSPPEHATARVLQERDESGHNISGKRPAGETIKNVSALGKALFRRKTSKMSLKDITQQERGLASRVEFMASPSRQYSVKQPATAKSASPSLLSLSKAAVDLANAYRQNSKEEGDSTPSSPSSPLGTPFWPGNLAYDPLRSRTATPSELGRCSERRDAPSRMDSASTRSATPDSPLRSRFSVNFSSLSDSRRLKQRPATLLFDEQIEVLEEHTDFITRDAWNSDDPRVSARSPIQKWQEEIVRKGPQQPSLHGTGRWQRMRRLSLNFMGVFSGGHDC